MVADRSHAPAEEARDPRAPERREARARRHAAWWLWLCNVLLGFLVGLAYLRDVPEGESLRLFAFAHLGLLSTIVTLTLVPGGLLWLAAGARWGGTSQRRMAAMQAAVWMLFHVALYTDTRVYRLFSYHLNGSAWNLVTTRGSEDAYHLGPKIWIVGFAIGLSVFALELLLWRLFLSRGRLVPSARAGRRLVRPALLWCAVLAVAVGVEKSIYAQADLVLDRQVTAVSQLFPMYPRLTVKPLLPESLRSLLERCPDVPVTHAGAELDYPLGRPGVDPAGPRPNVLLLVIDSWRGDMLDPQTTPGLWRFAQGSRRFADHLSGGNGTRFGVFSLLYGLHGTYWWPVLEARRSPVLIDELRALDYDMAVFSSASMSYPEFRETAWSDMPERVHDQFRDRRRWRRDELAVEACISWLRERRREREPRPFFAFCMLDSAHQPYDFPEDEPTFEPHAPELDYLELASSRDPALALRVRNRYRTALRFADRVASRLLGELERSGELGDTVVVITGDHGEEFAEHGHWGHTGNFSREQIGVPLILRAPGVAAGVEPRPTSHVDVAPTLLELCGADPARRGLYSVGESLLDPPRRRPRSAAGWEEVALWTEGAVFCLPRVPGETFRLGVLDSEWNLLPDLLGPFEAQAETLEGFSGECARFLRLPSPALVRGDPAR